MSSLVDGLVNFTAIDLIDVDGRPIGELASSLYDPVTTDVVACPFSGSRRGLPMNATALAQAQSVWPEVVASARALAGPEATVSRAFTAVMFGVTAPLVHAATFPDEPVPRLLSALFKTSLGFSQVLSTLLLADDGVANAPLADLGDRAAFMRFLEDGRWLIGQVHVCAGPPARIAELFTALTGAGPQPDLAPALAALNPAAIAPRAVNLVALQVAYMIARRSLGNEPSPGAWFVAPRAPWLRAVFSVPGRVPSHAARLFAAGAAPTALTAIAEARDVHTVEQRFADGLRDLS